MGSQKYPYKGIIDHLANRGFSNGTNAWTDTDHTAYTVSTAGEQGFLQLLPIYVDHILYPTMTKAGFITEVHHIDPKGADSGVVYSEMQGRENTSGDLMELRRQRLLNPPGSAYRSETGGLMEALRVLTVEQSKLVCCPPPTRTEVGR
jgi:Zn-dependent M16 (insulinase) family peptidase